MLKPQKKISRREIKEDKLITTYFNARGWVEKNSKNITYAVIGLIAAAVVIFLWTENRAESNEKATAALARIIPYYDQGNYNLAVAGIPQEGIMGLQAIVNEEGSTNAGQLAKLYLANSYYALKEYDKALECYDDISISDKMITSSAIAGAAACYEVKGSFDKAASYYEKAASKNMTNVQAPHNLQRAAINYAAAGKKDKAVEILQILKKEFPASPYAREADRFIAEFSS
ncbi:MAG: tetratricopeptide repeat protein [Bacteroidetes bacterium]|nr:tetratricopeptide repeat protein [Bacteroidota bacterium]